MHPYSEGQLYPFVGPAEENSVATNAYFSWALSAFYSVTLLQDIHEVPRDRLINRIQTEWGH